MHGFPFGDASCAEAPQPVLDLGARLRIRGRQLLVNRIRAPVEEELRTTTDDDQKQADQGGPLSGLSGHWVPREEYTGTVDPCRAEAPAHPQGSLAEQGRSFGADHPPESTPGRGS